MYLGRPPTPLCGIDTATPAAATGGAVRNARALLWACPLYGALLAALAALVVHRSGLLRRRPGVYLSHRRSDSAAETGRVVAALRRRYGRRAVVVGPPAVRWGSSLREEVGRAVSRCDVVCIVIGTDWTTSTNSSGRRRLMHVRDPVRVEVETALHAGVATLPVLVDGASTPDPVDLPETMRELADRPAVTVPPRPAATRHDDLFVRLDE